MSIDAPPSATHDAIDAFVLARSRHFRQLGCPPDVSGIISSAIMAVRLACMFPNATLFAIHRPLLNWLDSFRAYFFDDVHCAANLRMYASA